MAEEEYVAQPSPGRTIVLGERVLVELGEGGSQPLLHLPRQRHASLLPVDGDELGELIGTLNDAPQGLRLPERDGSCDAPSREPATAARGEASTSRELRRPRPQRGRRRPWEPGRRYGRQWQPRPRRTGLPRASSPLRIDGDALREWCASPARPRGCADSQMFKLRGVESSHGWLLSLIQPSGNTRLRK